MAITTILTLQTILTSELKVHSFELIAEWADCTLQQGSESAAHVIFLQVYHLNFIVYRIRPLIARIFDFVSPGWGLYFFIGLDFAM